MMDLYLVIKGVDSGASADISGSFIIFPCRSSPIHEIETMKKYMKPSFSC